MHINILYVKQAVALAQKLHTYIYSLMFLFFLCFHYEYKKVTFIIFIFHLASVKKTFVPKP